MICAFIINRNKYNKCNFIVKKALQLENEISKKYIIVAWKGIIKK